MQCAFLEARDLGFDVNAAIAAAREYQGIRDPQRSHDQISRAA